MPVWQVLDAAVNACAEYGSIVLTVPETFKPWEKAHVLDSASPTTLHSRTP